MFNYIFFDTGLRSQFVEFVQQRGVDYIEEPDPLGSCVISISEDLDENLSEEIDDYYDELFQMQEKLLEGTADRLEKNLVGVRVTLADGRPCMVRLNPDIVGRVLKAISMDELQELVAAAARAGENPDDRPVCCTEPTA